MAPLPPRCVTHVSAPPTERGRNKTDVSCSARAGATLQLPQFDGEYGWRGWGWALRHPSSTSVNPSHADCILQMTWQRQTPAVAPSSAAVAARGAKWQRWIICWFAKPRHSPHAIAVSEALGCMVHVPVGTQPETPQPPSTAGSFGHTVRYKPESFATVEH